MCSSSSGFGGEWGRSVGYGNCGYCGKRNAQKDRSELHKIRYGNDMSTSWHVWFFPPCLWSLFSHHSHTALDVCSLLKEKAWFKGNSRWSFSVPSTLLILLVPPSFISCWVFPLHESVVEKLDTNKILNECTCKCYIPQEWF